MSSTLPPGRLVFPAVVALVAAGVWYLWSNEGNTHNSTLADTVFGDLAFNPYAWWQAHDGAVAAYVHHYPATVAPNCLKIPFANERGTVAVDVTEGDEVYG